MITGLKVGEVAELNVESLTLDGEGVGSLAGRTVLCGGAFPGERVEVRIEAVSKHHPRAHGRLLEVVKAHEARRAAPCERHLRREGRCAGCLLMELDEPAQREAKRIMLRTRFGLNVDGLVPGQAALGYRHSSKRVAFGRRGFLYLGSFAYGSHTPANMRGCLVDHPALVRAFSLVEQAACDAGIVPFDEKTGAGDLRYVWGKTNGREVIITLTTARAQTQVRALLEVLSKEVSGVLHSVQSGAGNALRGTEAQLWFGQREVALELLGQKVEVGALGFVQPNPEVAALAYRSLTTLPGATRRDLAFDLYAGAGVTTRLLREQYREVIACEAHPESARALGVEPESVEAFLSRELAAAPRRVPELVIANPPRKGLGPEVCTALVALGAAHLHIMSCGPEGLARDLGALEGAYERVSLEAFDTLPQTSHVELVAKLVRRV